MKRVQIILEEWQHEWLAEEAQKDATSMSALLRQLLTEAIERRQTDSLTDDPIWEIVGIAQGPLDGITSENLDHYLYKTDWHRDEIGINVKRIAERALPLAEEKGTYDANSDS